ncbi:hypothetical protein Mnod_3137 [Methylobacterium nodulans ORS 2060]|uniref:Uncharacterized protein n=1 Tax=Methylobacterium nodulans (strain LMG 21967 / CNCM I-2342 / ORS 2060) TaxID=460265 RepID=B8IJM0_METNO|nr:recombinase family protein [Methylobacterium nodulans]ACL58068.1 hypothetical protein Mnod_3137 [Methylobacterium nodulans ORS 2060]
MTRPVDRGTSRLAQQDDPATRAGRGEAGRHASAARARRYRLALAPVLTEVVAEAGRTASGIAARLTERGVAKPRGGTVWTPADVRKLLRRLAAEKP